MSTSHSFSETGLSSAVLDNLDQLGYQHMTPIQAHSLAAILEGRDVMAQAMTGSGKTSECVSPVNGVEPERKKSP